MLEILNASQIESVFVSQPNKGISSTRICSRQRQKKVTQKKKKQTQVKSQFASLFCRSIGHALRSTRLLSQIFDDSLYLDQHLL